MTTTSESETARVEAIYDRIAPDWDKRQGFAERLLIGRGMRDEIAASLRGDVLEIATGTGVTLRNLAENQAITSYTGIDLSNGMLAQAQQAAAGVPFPVDLRQMDATRIDFPDAAFDSVTVSLSLCTVPDPAATLREMARVCRPEGRVVLLEHVLSPNRFVAWWQKRLAPAQHRMLGCHLDRQTDQLVRDLGFRVERDQTRLFGVFHLIVAVPPVEKRGNRK
jgi:ubiquinone/menaquinone biosynthesis C-methylase UbiE